MKISKTFLCKAVLLIVALSVVTALIFAAINIKSSAAADPIQKQTFFEQFVIAGGPIVWFVLLPMSVITVFLTVEYSLTIRRKKLLPLGIGKQLTELIQTCSLGNLKDQINQGDDLVSAAISKAIISGKGDFFRMRSLLAESFQDQAMSFLRKIEWINLIGNVAPMVGLFGTVYGMIKLFNAIVVAGGQPQPAHLAGGISVALVTTFWGLSIAIPALAIHGIFRNKIETLISQAVDEAETVMPEIRRSLKTKITKQPQQTKPKTAIREFSTKTVALTEKTSLKQ